MKTVLFFLMVLTLAGCADESVLSCEFKFNKGDTVINKFTSEERTITNCNGTRILLGEVIVRYGWENSTEWKLKE